MPKSLENPGVRVVLNSYDVMGGPNTFLMVWATKKFRDENPKTYSAFLAALNEAITRINADKPKYARVFVEFTKSKLAPDRILPYAQFMHQVGTLKNRPESWKDLFFPDIHGEAGS